MKKKLLIVTPILACKSEIHPIIKSLAFLENDFQLDFFDPLETVDITIEPYFLQWEQFFKANIGRYEGFIGFSFGGMILQQCFPVFEKEQGNKPIFLCSTPSFANESLSKKLTAVIDLCNAGKVSEALEALTKAVVLAPETPTPVTVENPEQAASRLTLGLKRALETDSRSILNTSLVQYWHLVGAQSQLVNQGNVTTAKRGQLIIVPDAGMRVLQDNPSYCQRVIRDKLCVL